MNDSSPMVSQALTFLVAASMAGVLAFAGSGYATVDHATPVEPAVFAVPGNQAWVSTGVTLDLKQKLLIEEVERPPQLLVKGSQRQAVSARGTYLFDVETGPYPLEPDRVHTDRRYPGYYLIGRIGETGAPFFVGSHFQGVAPQAGVLWLGINDPTPQRNRGAFHCRISQETGWSVSFSPVMLLHERLRSTIRRTVGIDSRVSCNLRSSSQGLSSRRASWELVRTSGPG